MKGACRAWQKHFKHFLLDLSLWAPREKALFPSHWALPRTSHPTSLRHGLTKAIPSLPSGHRGFLPACPWCDHLLLFTCSEMEEVLLTLQLLLWQSVPFPGVSPLLAQDQWNPLRLHTCTSYQGKGGGDSVPEAMFLLGKNPYRIQRQSLSFLLLLLFPTIPLFPVISCSFSLHCCCLLIRHFDTDPIFILSNSPLTPFSRVPPTWSPLCFSSHSACSSSYLSVFLIGIQPSPGCIMKISCSKWQRNH